MNLKQINYTLGFFLVTPFIYIPLGAVNLRIDDIIIVIISFFVLAIKRTNFNHNTIALSLIFILMMIIGLTQRLDNSIVYSNYPSFRILGISLYFFVLSFSIIKKNYIIYFLKGVVFGSKLFLIISFCALFFHMYSLGFRVIDLYSIKDSLYILGEYNPNTYGAMMIFSSFCSYTLYKLTNNKKHKNLAILFLLFPVIYLIKRDIFGILVGLSYLFLSNRSTIIKLIIYGALSIISASAISWIVYMWNDPEFIILMARRVEIYNGAFTLISENPFGHGVGSEIAVLEPLTGRALVSHNSFLSLLIELGVFATSIFLLSLGYIFRKIKAKWIRFYFIIFLSESLFGNGLYFYKYHLLFIATAVLFYSISKKQKREISLFENPSQESFI